MSGLDGILAIIEPGYRAPQKVEPAPPPPPVVRVAHPVTRDDRNGGPPREAMIKAVHLDAIEALLRARAPMTVSELVTLYPHLTKSGLRVALRILKQHKRAERAGQTDERGQPGLWIASVAP